MREYELAVEFLSFFQGKRIVNRLIYKVIFGSPDHYGYIAQMKVAAGNKIYVNPNITYEAFQRLLADHFNAEIINLKWLKRPPMIQDVIEFEWKNRKESSSTITV